MRVVQFFILALLASAMVGIGATTSSTAMCFGLVVLGTMLFVTAALILAEE